MKISLLLKTTASLGILLFTFQLAKAQSVDEILSNGEVRGNFQLDAQYYQEDTLIGAQDVPEKILYKWALLYGSAL